MLAGIEGEMASVDERDERDQYLLQVWEPDVQISIRYLVFIYTSMTCPGSLNGLRQITYLSPCRLREQRLEGGGVREDE